jgi:hypothetical protein
MGLFSQVKRTREKVTWVDAAARILHEEREPLAPRTITDLAIQRKLIRPKKQANVQMAASIKGNISSAQRSARKARFFSIGKGKYGLMEWLRGARVTNASLAYWILKSEKTPIHYQKIAERIVKAKGFKRMPSNFPVTIHVCLNNDKRFKLAKGGTFSLKALRVRPPVQYKDRFTFSRPDSFFKIFEVIAKFLKGARRLVKICTPYIDKTTFENMLQALPYTADVQLIINRQDNRWSDKVKQGLDAALINEFMKDRQMLTKRTDDLHSRFVIVDDASLLILSADLQRDQCISRNQYAMLTSNTKVVRNAVKFYSALWNDAKICNLAKDAKPPKTTAARTTQS